MLDLLPHIVGAITAVLALIGAWLKFRSERKPPGNDPVTQINHVLRTDPQRLGYGEVRNSLGAGLIGGLGAVAVVEGTQAALVHLDHHLSQVAGDDTALSDGLDLPF